MCATGVPQKQNGHAVLMAEFVTIAMKKMRSLVKRLEIKFGPDTSELSLRVGMHSGPVTGGFLMGKGSRFQVSLNSSSVAIILFCLLLIVLSCSFLALWRQHDVS